MRDTTNYTDLRETLAKTNMTFKDGDIVKYIAPDRVLGPFRVGIMDDGSVGLWFRSPGREYTPRDDGDHVHAIVERGETFPGTGTVMDRSVFTTMGADSAIRTNYLFKLG